jgi:endonuclease YncB( thermonuclease family)
MGRNLPDPFALRQIRQLTSVVPDCRGRVVFFALCIVWVTNPALLAHSFTGQVERVIDPPLAVASRRAGGDRLNCFTGTVTRVVDGDTVVVLAPSTRDRFPITVPGKPPIIESVIVRLAEIDAEHQRSLRDHGARQAPKTRLVIVRLAEIDAPEMKTGFGPRAKKALSDLVLGKTVVVTWKRRGRYRRIIGQVYLREMWINHELVARGWAWQFKRYSRNKELGIAESEAHRAARGVWAAAESEEESNVTCRLQRKGR